MTPTQMLQLYIDAEAKVLSGQTVEMNGRKLGRANLAEIRAGRQEWERKVAAAQTALLGRRSSYSLASFD